MSRTTRNPILLLALLLMAGLGLCGHAFASSTATIAVGGGETTGDAATITITFNGFVETVRYGQFSTPTSIASAFGAMFSRDYLQDGLCASASGNTITFKLKGGATFGALDITGSTASFQMTPSGFASAASQVADFGTVQLSINGSVIASTDYGADSTPDSIAESLAESASSSLVNVTAFGNTLHLDATATGTGSDSISYTVANAGWDETDFTQPSFPSSIINGYLAGGTDQSTDTPAEVYSYSVPSSGYDGVGNLKSYTDSVMGAWDFNYDTLNRLVMAQNTATTSTSTQYGGDYGCWSYDSFGNRLSESISTTPCTSTPLPLTSWANYNANNQFTSTNAAPGGVSYDASGDVTNDGINQYLYDAEGRICAVASTPMPNMTTMTGYIYDAEGTRVAKGTIRAWSCDPSANGFITTADYVLGPNGEQASEMSVSGGASTWSHTNVWAGGKLLATYDMTGKGLHFYLDDPLGTRRVQTDELGVVEQSCSSLPFGDGLSCTGSITSPTEHHYTGKERDTESGNDYFQARYYSSTMGRFMSPDWAAKAEPVPYAKLDNPQTLNLYAYMRNNPLGGTDPDGHCDWCQKLWNYANKKGWKTDEQVAQKGVNNNTVLVQTSSIPGNTDTKEPDNKDVRHVTYTPTKIENGVLKGPVSTNPADPNVKVTLWESNPNVDNGSYANQGTTNGSGKDRILTGAGILSPSVDQHWSVNGERVQVVVGKNADGTVQTTWQLHVDRSGDVPKFTPVATPAPE